MPFCAYCGASTAAVSYKPCPNCGNPTNGAPRPALATGGTNAGAIVIAVVVVALVFTAIIGILSAIAIPNLLTAMQRSKQKRSMADLRTIATATEAYATDTNRYPRVTSIEELRALIQPRYIKAMPIIDGWGHPYRYECGTPGTDACQEYIVGSGGKDGIFEHESLRDYPKPGGATQAFDCDLIYANGSFIEYPESMARGD